MSDFLAENGFYIEIFCGTSGKSHGVNQGKNLRINYIRSNNWNFKFKVIRTFRYRNRSVSFNKMESVEYLADSLLIQILFPKLYSIIKLHTPKFLINELTGKKQGFSKSFKFLDPEYWSCKLANELISPSESLAEIVKTKWFTQEREIQVIRNIYTPVKSGDKLEKRNIITFIGRMEERKGIYEYVEALKLCIEDLSEFELRFIGKAPVLNDSKLTFNDYFLNEFKENTVKINFTGFLTGDALFNAIAESRICVFPSRWENYPYVCLEAMNMSCAIIGSAWGGIKEILEQSKGGIIIDPFDTKDFSNALRLLAKDSLFVEKLSNNNHNYIHNYYPFLNQQILEFYKRS